MGHSFIHIRIFQTLIVALLAVCCVPISSRAAVSESSTPMIRWGDERADTVKLASVYNTLLSSTERNKGSLVLLAARQFVGVPYVGSTLEAPVEMLSVNTAGLDCTTLVELSMALAKSVSEGETDWRAAMYDLRDMRYRGGVVDGYASRLHYVTEWIIDNTYRKNIKDVTSDAPRSKAITSSVNFMTSHRDKYPQLADSLTYTAIKQKERGLHLSRYYYIPKTAVASREVRDFLENGDVVFITTSIEGLDVSHAGVIFKDERGVPHLLHASSAAGKVVEDPVTLADYLSRQKKATGIRIVRLR